LELLKPHTIRQIQQVLDEAIIAQGKVAMMLRLGYFENCKGADTVLSSRDPVEVPPLREVLADAMAKGIPFAIHDLAVVSARNPAREYDEAWWDRWESGNGLHAG
jgi:hypothetical protein